MTTTPTTPAPASPATITPPRRFRRTKRLLKSLITIYLLVCLVIYAFQTSLIFPGSFRQGSADIQFTHAPDEELLHLTTADGIPVTALFGKARTARGREEPAAATRPTVLYFYGNGDAMASSLYQFNMFRHLGNNCIILDYPGFGLSGGKPSETNCYAAAEAAYQHLLSRPDIDHHKLIPAGWSLGGAVAVDLAARHQKDQTLAGLMTFCTFTSMADMARLNYPFLPTSLLLKHHFASEQKAADIALPWFIAHGRSDTAIPFAMSDRLASAAKKATVTRFSPQPANHNDFFELSEAELLPALTAFFNSLEGRQIENSPDRNAKAIN